jgi:hypothetical protein
MTQLNKDFCFCTLALGSKYRLMIKDLAADLKKYSLGTFLIVGTDEPNDFSSIENIIAFKLVQQGIFSCYNDKRFVLEKGLLQFNRAIFLDADTRINNQLPEIIQCSPGINGCHKNILEHIQKYRPKNINYIQKVAAKFNINLDTVNWIGESLFIVTQDNGKEQEFLATWGKIASYLELKGMHSGEGNIMGLAAAKVGWTVEKSDSWKTIKQSIEHLDASRQKSNKSFGDKLKRRLGYHYRLNKSKLLALKDFDFYYR